jgi:hypothetical protein
MESLTAFTLQWNDAAAEPADWSALWSQFQSTMPEMSRRAAEWQQQMLANGDFAANLLKFAGKIRSAAEENKV